MFQAANDTVPDTMVGDTFDIEDCIYEVVEQLSSDEFRLNDGRTDITLRCDEIVYCARVVAR